MKAPWICAGLNIWRKYSKSALVVFFDDFEEDDELFEDDLELEVFEAEALEELGFAGSEPSGASNANTIS